MSNLSLFLQRFCSNTSGLEPESCVFSIKCLYNIRVPEILFKMVPVFYHEVVSLKFSQILFSVHLKFLFIVIFRLEKEVLFIVFNFLNFLFCYRVYMSKISFNFFENYFNVIRLKYFFHIILGITLDCELIGAVKKV